MGPSSSPPNHPTPPSSHPVPAEPTTTPRQPGDEVLAYRLITSYYVDDGSRDFTLARENILHHLDLLRTAYPDLRELHGKRILDVACGARGFNGNIIAAEGQDSSLRFDPWMSRLLVSFGAHPVGLDICRQVNESFESHEVDLTKKNALAFLPSNSFDAFYVSGFPTIDAIQQFVSDERAWPEVRDEILSHLHRSLKEGGIVIRSFTERTESFVESNIHSAKKLICSIDDL